MAGKKWTVPVGGGAGRVFKIGKLPINIMLAGYYNLVKPQYGAEWAVATRGMTVSGGPLPSPGRC